MSYLGNVLWFLCGGFISGLAWIFAGLIWCISIIGIPIGLQCFKFSGLSFFPFGKEVIYGGGYCVSDLVQYTEGTAELRDIYDFEWTDRSEWKEVQDACTN